MAPLSKHINLLIIAISISLMSCNTRPAHVLPEKKMVNLMADMQIAEAYINTKGSSSSDERVDVGKVVLQKHGVTEEDLDSTLSWYGRNMDDYSELFEKVDKEILKRKEKLTDDIEVIVIEGDDLWPYGKHLTMSQLSGQDYFHFKLPVTDFERGGKLDFNFFMPNPAGIKATLGVEYKDGFGEANVSNLSSKNKIILELQTDSAREVSKIYGVIRLKDTKSLPLLIDSISLKAEPIDTLSYRNKRRQQKLFQII